MIHWSFLIPAFAAGLAAGTGAVYQVVKITLRIGAAIEAGARAWRI